MFENLKNYSITNVLVNLLNVNFVGKLFSIIFKHNIAVLSRKRVRKNG